MRRLAPFVATFVALATSGCIIGTAVDVTTDVVATTVDVTTDVVDTVITAPADILMGSDDDNDE